MPSTFTPFADEANVTIQEARRPPSADARSRAAAKGAATLQRHARERRDSDLADIRAQIANGTLVVRQMTSAERGAASGAPRRTPACAPAPVVLSAQEQERHRIAVGVHDDSLQAIFAVSLGLAHLKRRVEDQDAIEALERLQETVEYACRRLRNLVFELHPPGLDNQGLISALRSYLEHAKREEGLGFTLDDQLSSDPPAEIGAFILRAVQELLMNVRKHAQATHVTVSLTAIDGRHVIQVRDDGIGFNTAEALRPRTGHLGLAAMTERLRVVGGVLRVDSDAQAGTTVEFEVPAPGTCPLPNRAVSSIAGIHE
jgi:signal transduction histidine kinase